MKITTKIIGLIVLALFCLSILPIAFADNDKSEDRIRGRMLFEGNEIESESRTEISDGEVEIEERIRVRERSEDDEEDENEIDDKEEDENEVDDDSDKRFEKFEKIREKLKEAQEKIKENRKSLLKIKERVSSCREEEDCFEIKKELRRGVVDHLEKSLNVLVNLIAKVKDRVENSALSEEERSGALIQLVEAEEKANALLANLSSANIETAEEVKTTIKEVKEIWKDAQETQRSLVAQLMSKKTEDLIEKHQILSARMQTMIDTLSGKGLNVTAMEEIHARFDEHIAKVEEDYKKAEDLRESGDRQAWRKAMQIVKDDLGESRKLLREFTRAQRDLKSTDVAEQDEEQDEEQETNDGSEPENNQDNSNNNDDSNTVNTDNQTEVELENEVTV